MFIVYIVVLCICIDGCHVIYDLPKSLHVHCTVVVIVFVYRLILEHRYYRY